MRALESLASLDLLGSSQWGLVTTAQAHEAGVSKMQLSRLVDRGTVQRVRHGVYALPSADTGPLQGLRAAWLATGSEPVGHQLVAVVSGESAAAVHGLGDLLPAKYEFSTPVRRQTTQPDVRYRKRDLPDEDVTWVNGLPVTTVARTVQDLATGGTDFDHLAVAVRDAVATTDVASDALVQALEPAAARFRSPDGHALFVATLKAADFRPDTRVMELVIPELQQRLLQSLTPQLQRVVSQTIAEQLRQLAPSVDPSALTQHLLSAALPDTKALTRELTHRYVRVPELQQTAGKTPETRDAARRQERDADDGTTTDTAGGEPAQSVSGDEAGERGQEARRRS